jgi:hypothetical protein
MVSEWRRLGCGYYRSPRDIDFDDSRLTVKERQRTALAKARTEHVQPVPKPQNMRIKCRHWRCRGERLRSFAVRDQQ